MTRLLVLGILDWHPMSGYDIQQTLQSSDAQQWGNVLTGSVYHALNKLEQDGCIEIVSIEKAGRRQKAIYQITQSGRQHLKQLVQEALAVPSAQYPADMYSGLSFVSQVAPQFAREALEEQKNKLEAEYESVQAALDAKKKAFQNQIPPMTSLVFENMFAIIRQQLEFVEKASQMI